MNREVGRRSDLLLQAGSALASDLSLPSVLQKIVDLACEVADARYGALGVIGGDGRIDDFITYGVTEHERRAIGDLPQGKGLLGVLIREARPLRLTRIQDHEASYGFPDNHPPMTSFLGVPIEVHGEVFGNLYLTEKRGGIEFTEDDERAVVTLAAQAGIAIENARLYRDARAQQTRLSAVNEVTQAILDGRETLQVLRLIAGYAREMVGAAVATVAQPQDGELALCVAVGDRAEDLLGMRFPVEGSISGEVMRRGEGIVLDDVSRDPRAVQPLVRVGGFGPMMLVPLSVGEHTFGTLSVANHPGGRRFTDDDVVLVRLFASQAAVALEYGRLRAELDRLLLIEERERIAKDLHDGVIQSLFAVGMALQAAEAVSESEDVRARLASAVEDIDRTIRDLRDYIFSLRPGDAADRQLDAAMLQLVQEFRRATEAHIELLVEPPVAAELAGRAREVLQAAREAISNAVRHSGGSRITVELRRVDGAAILAIADDGRGFDPGQVGGAGQGLRNLEARARALGGDLSIGPAAEGGTEVRITIWDSRTTGSGERMGA